VKRSNALAKNAGDKPSPRSRSSSADRPARKREFELGLQNRRRSPELMTGVGDESPLARERRFQAHEHRVERVSPRRWIQRGDIRRPRGQPVG